MKQDRNVGCPSRYVHGLWVWLFVLVGLCAPAHSTEVRFIFPSGLIEPFTIGDGSGRGAMAERRCVAASELCTAFDDANGFAETRVSGTLTSRTVSRLLAGATSSAQAVPAFVSVALPGYSIVLHIRSPDGSSGGWLSITEIQTMGSRWDLTVPEAWQFTHTEDGFILAGRYIDGSRVHCVMEDLSEPVCVSHRDGRAEEIIEPRRHTRRFDEHGRYTGSFNGLDNRGYAYRATGGFVSLATGRMIFYDTLDAGSQDRQLSEYTSLNDVTYDRDGYPYIERHCIWAGPLSLQSAGCRERVWTFRELTRRERRRLDRAARLELRQDPIFTGEELAAFVGPQ